MKEVKRLELSKSETEALFTARVLLGRMRMFLFSGNYGKDTRNTVDSACSYVDDVLRMYGSVIDLTEKDVKFEEDENA